MPIEKSQWLIMQKIAIIGTTSWGMTLAWLLSNKGLDVRLWARTPTEADSLREKGPDAARYPDITLPTKILITSDAGRALEEASAVIMVVPSATMRHNISQVAGHLTQSTLVISAAKGLEAGTHKRMSQVIAEEINPHFKSNICVLSGPNLAREILQNLPAAAVVAAADDETARKVQRLLTCPNFCVFTNTDIIGVELGGALKNIIALGAGIADGLGYGDNAKAAFMTRGLTEITALGTALGANPLTFSGLAGLGDIITTCASTLSRNHYVGTELAKGRKYTEILESMSEVAEGINTTLVARDIARQMGMEMPITEKIYQVLYENVDCRQAAAELMGADNRHELSGRRWQLFSLFRRKKDSPAG
jgi:glycerol-3-phosphate dehydrogenase (NAD(P)+)